MVAPFIYERPDQTWFITLNTSMAPAISWPSTFTRVGKQLLCPLPASIEFWSVVGSAHTTTLDELCDGAVRHVADSGSWGKLSVSELRTCINLKMRSLRWKVLFALAMCSPCSALPILHDAQLRLGVVGSVYPWWSQWFLGQYISSWNSHVFVIVCVPTQVTRYYHHNHRRR